MTRMHLWQVSNAEMLPEFPNSSKNAWLLIFVRNHCCLLLSIALNGLLSSQKLASKINKQYPIIIIRLPSTGYIRRISRKCWQIMRAVRVQSLHQVPGYCQLTGRLYGCMVECKAVKNQQLALYRGNFFIVDLFLNACYWTGRLHSAACSFHVASQSPCTSVQINAIIGNSCMRICKEDTWPHEHNSS